MGAAFSANPYRVYDKLRQLGTPYYYADMDAWLLSIYADVDEAARNGSLVRSLEAFLPAEAVAVEKRKRNWHDMPNHARLVQTSLLDSDGEQHRRLRTLLVKVFSRHFVHRYKPMIQHHVDNLLAMLIEQQQFDFIHDFAAQVPGHIIGHIIGVPEQDCEQLRTWSENVVQFFDVERTDDHKQLAEQSTTDFYHYLRKLIVQRREQPKGDLLSTLIDAQRAGKLNETELISTCMLLLMAGHGSTIDVLGTGMYTLLLNPEQWRKLRKEPQWVSHAVHEMFRFESPLPFFHRYASKDITLFGRTFAKGTKFGLLYGSANRDPQAFPNAERFDITRQPNRHIAFGRGAHLCLGNQLARLNMEIVFTRLMQRVNRIELCGPTPQFKPGLSTRGLHALPVTVGAR